MMTEYGEELSPTKENERQRQQLLGAVFKHRQLHRAGLFAFALSRASSEAFCVIINASGSLCQQEWDAGLNCGEAFAALARTRNGS